MRETALRTAAEAERWADMHSSPAAEQGYSAGTIAWKGPLWPSSSMLT